MKFKIRESISEQIKTVFSGFNSGDLIISNHLSYIDILYFGFRFSPIFATIVLDNDRPKVVKQTLSGAFLKYVFNSQPTSSSQETLTDIVLEAKNNHLGPVVIFPE